MGAKFLKIYNDVEDLYKVADNSEKRELLNYVLQNLTLDGESLSYKYKKPFDIFAKGLNRNKKLPELSKDRTFCIDIFEAMTQTSCDLFRNIEDFMQNIA